MSENEARSPSLQHIYDDILYTMIAFIDEKTTVRDLLLALGYKNPTGHAVTETMRIIIHQLHSVSQTRNDVASPRRFYATR